MAMGMGLRLPKSERTRDRRQGRGASATDADDPSSKKKKKKMTSAAWQEAKRLIWARRGRLALGLALMLVNRLAGLVLPATSKYLIDAVSGKGRRDLLMPLAFTAGATTVLPAATAFAFPQVLVVCAQR